MFHFKSVKMDLQQSIENVSIEAGNKEEIQNTDKVSRNDSDTIIH
jgi:hypothetical protein